MRLTDVLAPMALHCHIVTFWIFITFELVETTTVHSGYAFLPGISRFIRFHDWHHEYFNGCFGAMGWIDWFHGTDKGFKKTYSERDIGIQRTYSNGQENGKKRHHHRNRAWLDVE